MITINIKENENFETCLRKFKKTCDKLGIISECKSRKFHEKPSTKRKNSKSSKKKKK
ncbi:30S ribosomal protein S21 [Candidatus Nardonella dryophthoridicola]|uniref:Small ribosomal subunit protein bS21 n=1 Tax=endosymbiont of Rhynchophorus ferrugineus TaxID=1972133 RepID=A0A2Z5T3P1_9GAMM|nr:30S ribosomal protein S21 [Candidatus Nardonella dryophthoridicola]QTJ62968.1 30S ribosomal protein S21 [Candidatus Nardonella dryophthoridicola]BBA85021.1 30S ribosomal protein S21 [endosymbiont of Rhynchophorus ferrugineus]